MTPKEIARIDAAVPEATDLEIARVFCTHSAWDFSEGHYTKAKVALVAARARGLTPKKMRALVDEAKDGRDGP